MTIQSILPFFGVPIEEKTVGHVTYKQEPEVIKSGNYFKKSVIWLNRSPDSWGRWALRGVEKTLLLSSLIGIPKLLKFNSIESKMKKLKAFHDFIENKQSPNILLPIWVSDKDKKYATGPFLEFAISDGVVWMRRKKTDGNFLPVYWDGFENSVPEQIATDGKNLMVVCRNKKGVSELHYIKFATSKITYKKDGSISYSFILKQTFDTWIPEWFTREGLTTKFVNLIIGPKLRMPTPCLWACSERSHLAQNKYEDGVTTVYIFDEKNNVIKLLDPWVPSWVNVWLPLPKRFELKSMDASGSVLLIIGWQLQKDKKVLKVMTFEKADITQLGWNPKIPSTYNINEKDNRKPLLPVNNWKNHPIPLKVDVSLPGTIVQTGGDGRELRISAKRGKQKGFIYKDVNVDKWRFFPHKTVPFLCKIGTKKVTDIKDKLKSLCKNYSGSISHIKKMSASVFELKDFDLNRTIRAEFFVKIQKRIYQLILYRRDELVKDAYSFSEKANYCHYDLVIPHAIQKEGIPEKLKQFFGGKLSISLRYEKFLLDGAFILKNDKLGIKFCLVQKEKKNEVSL